MSILSFIEQGTEEDDKKLHDSGIDPLSSATLPYYARWLRQDIVGIFYLLNRSSKIIICLLALIAIPLWIIAFKAGSP